MTVNLSTISSRTLLEELSKRNLFGFRQTWCSECCSLDVDSERSYHEGCTAENCEHDYGDDYPLSLCDRCQEKYEQCPDCSDDKWYCAKARSQCAECEEWLCREHAGSHKCSSSKN